MTALAETPTVETLTDHGACILCNDPAWTRIDSRWCHPCCDYWAERGHGRCPRLHRIPTRRTTHHTTTKEGPHLMARIYAQITTSIWRDDDFRSLTVEQQNLYFTLDSQGEITAAGTLPLTERRWSKLASDWTVDRITKVLGEMADLGHFAVDEDTEEVLIVKFVKWDQGFRNTKRLPVIRDAALAIASPILRRVLALELTSLGLPDMASELLGDTASDSASDGIPPSDRVVVKQGDHRPQPVTANPEGGTAHPNPQPPDASGATAPPMFCPRHPEGTDQPCGACADARKRRAAYDQGQTSMQAQARRDAVQARSNEVFADIAAARAASVPRPADTR